MKYHLFDWDLTSGGEKNLFETLRHLKLNLKAAQKLISGLGSGGILAINTQLYLIATVGQRGFWDEQQRVSKLQEKKPVLKRLSESIPWEIILSSS